MYGTIIPEPEMIEGPLQARKLLREIQNINTIAVDTETTGLNRWKDNVVFWSMATEDRRWCLDRAALPTFRKYLQDPDRTLIFQNVNFDRWMLKNSGVDLHTYEGRATRKEYRCWDTAVMHCLWLDNQFHDLKSMARKILKVDMISFRKTFGGAVKDTGKLLTECYETDPQRVIDYASLDAWATFKIHEFLVKKLDDMATADGGSMLDYYHELEMPNHDVLWQMERRGSLINMDYLQEVIPQVEEAMYDVQRIIAKKAGRIIKLGSTKQLVDLWYRKGTDGGWYDRVSNEKLKSFELTGGGASGNRQPCTDKAALERRYESGCEYAKLIRQWRDLQKSADTYMIGMAKRCDPEGRIHTSFNQHIVKTGRLCVAGDTVLETDQGSFQISKLDLSKMRKPRIMTHEGRWRPIVNLFEKGREMMYKVRLENGSEIKCTMGHRFLTENGWRHLHEISKGDLLYSSGTDLHEGREPEHGVSRDSHERGINAVGHRVVRHDAAGSSEALPGAVRPVLEQESTVLGQEVSSGVRRGKKQESLEAGQGERDTRRARGTSGSPTRQGAVGGGPRGRETPPNPRPNVRDQRVLRTPKHRVSRPLHQQPIATQATAGGHCPAGSARAVLSRNLRSSDELPQRSGTVLQPAVRSFRVLARDVLVHQGPGKIPQLLRGSKKHPKEPRLLEFQQVRASLVAGSATSRSSSHQGVLLLQEPPSGLLLQTMGIVSRDRRGVPPARGYAEKRQEKGAGRGEIGIGIAPIYHERGGKGCGKGSGHDRRNWGLSRVEAIEPVGVELVWDIEVEEDHSYAACGFLNHNSSSDPNLQNIPAAYKDKYKIRNIFVAPPGYTIGCADYAQLEMRIVASIANERGMIDAILEGRDQHCWNVHRMFGVPYEEAFEAKQAKDAKQTLTARQAELCKLRDDAKTIGFGVLYGEGPWKLSADLECSLDEAKAKLAAFFDGNPAIKQLQDDIIYYGEGSGYVLTPMGRRRQLPGLCEKARSYKTWAEAKRAGVNMPIQGHAAEIVKAAQIRIYEDDYLWDSGVRMNLQVHDELCSEWPEEIAAEKDAVDLWTNYMANPFGDKVEALQVPLSADISFGPSWMYAK